MPYSPDPQATSRSSLLAVAILIAVGYSLTLLVFYPGVMTYDAKFVYEDIAKHTLGDWQSPAMTVLWALIDPIAPGSASMFLLIVSFYWLGFGLLAFTLARRSVLVAVCVLILALAPPAFAFVGMIWRDMLFSTTWLLAAVIVFATLGRGERLRVMAQVLAIVLCVFGVLLRPNALTAAPILGAYIAWPMKVYWKRAAIAFVPAMVLFFLLVQFVYYGVLGATRQHPLQSIMVFDLGGISHFTRENQYPVTWTPAESKLLLEIATGQPSGTSTGGSRRASSSCTSWKRTKRYLAPPPFKVRGLTPCFVIPSPISSTAPGSCGIFSRARISQCG